MDIALTFVIMYYRVPVLHLSVVIYIKLQGREEYSVGSVAQSVERRDGILKVTGSSPGLAGYFSHFVIIES